MGVAKHTVEEMLEFVRKFGLEIGDKRGICVERNDVTQAFGDEKDTVRVLQMSGVQAHFADVQNEENKRFRCLVIDAKK